MTARAKIASHASDVRRRVFTEGESIQRTDEQEQCIRFRIRILQMSARRSAEDQRLTRLAKICLALPETARSNRGSHNAFLVGKRIFAYFLNDHHGDGIVSVACKALAGDNKLLAAAQPTRFYLPAYIGPRGWVALRLDTGEVDWEEVAELVMGSYRLVAPKRLLAFVPATDNSTTNCGA